MSRSNCCVSLKRIVYKRNSFNHPHVVPNLYDFLASVKHKRGYFEKGLNCFVYTMEVRLFSFFLLNGSNIALDFHF